MSQRLTFAEDKQQQNQAFLTIHAGVNVYNVPLGQLSPRTADELAAYYNRNNDNNIEDNNNNNNKNNDNCDDNDEDIDTLLDELLISSIV